MRAIIFANGVLNQPLDISTSLLADDVVIAADGGSRHCQALGIQPHFAIGDFDSLEEKDLLSLVANGTQLLRFPERKDFTDLELALQHARHLEANPIIIYGALGLRWDQTLANLLLPGAYTDLKITLIDGLQEICLITPQKPISLHGFPGDIVSLIPLQVDAIGVVTQGLEYPLYHETLYFGVTRGISNTMLTDTVTVSLDHGSLLCVLIHQPLTPPTEGERQEQD